MNLYQDEAFLSLLSSQRQLLSQLNVEIGIGRSCTANTQPPKSQQKSLYMNHSPMSHIVNQSQDMLMARRFSLGISLEQFASPNFPYSDELGSDISCHSRLPKKGTKTEHSWESQKWKRRRLSTNGLGFLSETAFEDCSELDCVNPIITWGKEEIRQHEEPIYVAISDNQDSDSDDEESSGSECIESLKLEDTGTDDLDIRRATENFIGAMEKSQESQQAIHDWDRKMGLKRSHSQTMRLSARSRKQLRAVLKRGLRPK